MVNFYGTTRHRIPEDSRPTLHSHRRESLKFCTVLMYLNLRLCVEMRGMHHALSALIPVKESLTSYPFFKKLSGLLQSTWKWEHREKYLAPYRIVPARPACNIVTIVTKLPGYFLTFATGKYSAKKPCCVTQNTELRASWTGLYPHTATCLCTLKVRIWSKVE
jgi:hypothetical protein